MKKLITIVFLISLTVASYSQIFKPVTPATFNAKHPHLLTGTDKSIEWLVRLQLSITGNQWNYDKQLQKITCKQLVSGGAGLGLQHYKDINTNPYSDYGLYLLVLYGQEQPATRFTDNSFSLALVFNGLGILNVGPVFDLGSNKLGLLTGVSIKF